MRVRLVGVVALSIVFLAAPMARASRLAVKGTAQGGGTLVNSGSGDVGTNDGTSAGNTSLWIDLGFGSTADFLVYGYKIPGPFTFDTVEVTDLIAIATVELPFDCPGCNAFPLDLLSLVSYGSNLKGGAENDQTVAWYAHLQPVPTTMQDGQVYQFALGPGADADKLTSLIAVYGGDKIHIGLSAALDWPPFTGAKFPGEVDFVTPNDAAPEPASLILLGSGLVGLAGAARARRRQRHSGPAAPDRMKLPQ